MPDVVKHAWTHRPKEQGGTDPFPIDINLKWATAVMFLTSTAKDGDAYYASFTKLGTNDTDAFTLEDADWGKSLGINLAGYYHAWFAIVTGSGTAWGANYATLQPIWEQAGSDNLMNSGTNEQTDFDSAFYGRETEQYAAEVPASAPRHRGMSMFMSFLYDTPAATDSLFGEQNPLKLGVNMLTDATGSIGFGAQIHVTRVADASYSLINA